MDWAKAIEINQQALIRIIAALFAMLGLADGGVLERPPRAVCLAVLRILRRAESAVRRLIVIVARELAAVPLSARTRRMPAGLVIAGKPGGGRAAFQLFDSRKRLVFGRPKRPVTRFVPHIWFGGHDPIAPPFYPRPAAIPEPAPKPEDDGGTQRLGRRLAAIKSALGDLPRQARRLARWQARRDQMKSPKFTSPLRPGAPPGYRREPEDDFDFVLKECHALARDALAANTS